MARAKTFSILAIIALLTLSGCTTTPEFEDITLPESSVSIEENTDQPDVIETISPPEDEIDEIKESSEPSNSATQPTIQQPPTGNLNAGVEDYATSITLTETARELFFSTDPEIVGLSKLQNECGKANASEKSNVLGCFTTNPTRIYLYDITDARMVKAENVIAAHELLHAVWYLELTSNERADLTTELKTFFDALPRDHFLRDRLNVYASSPDSIPTELHSILGTEALSLTPSLEAHYSKYFKNRAAIVQDSEDTFGYLRELSRQSKEGSQKIGIIREEIEAERKTLTRQSEELSADIDDFNLRAESGEMTMSEYEQERNDLDGRKTEVNLALDKFNKKVADFNQLVADNNAIAELVNSLNAAITTK